jgi:hypothetical protein
MNKLMKFVGNILETLRRHNSSSSDQLEVESLVARGKCNRDACESELGLYITLVFIFVLLGTSKR